jgi:hypothetical protein
MSSRAFSPFSTSQAANEEMFARLCIARTETPRDLFASLPTEIWTEIFDLAGFPLEFAGQINKNMRARNLKPRADEDSFIRVLKFIDREICAEWMLQLRRIFPQLLFRIVYVALRNRNIAWESALKSTLGTPTFNKCVACVKEHHCVFNPDIYADFRLWILNGVREDRKPYARRIITYAKGEICGDVGTDARNAFKNAEHTAFRLAFESADVEMLNFMRAHRYRPMRCTYYLKIVTPQVLTFARERDLDIVLDITYNLSLETYKMCVQLGIPISYDCFSVYARAEVFCELGVNLLVQQRELAQELSACDVFLERDSELKNAFMHVSCELMTRELRDNPTYTLDDAFTGQKIKRLNRRVYLAMCKDLCDLGAELAKARARRDIAMYFFIKSLMRA